MGIKISQSNVGAQTMTLNAETALMTTSPYVYDNPNPFVGGEHAGTGQGVTISGMFNLTVGTTATTVTVRVRQGTIAGPIVGGAGATLVQTVVAGNNVLIPFEFLDTTRFPAQSGGAVYVVTAQMGAATGNSTVQPITTDVMGA